MDGFAEASGGHSPDRFARNDGVHNVC